MQGKSNMRLPSIATIAQVWPDHAQAIRDLLEVGGDIVERGDYL